MGLPSKRRTNRSKRDRASHFALTAVTVSKCSECGAITLPHRACKKCGTYRGRKAINVEKRKSRSARKKKSGK
jgi:large subunit ribosomal protein L32